ncbi:MAG: ribosomal protein S18 acetylase RimI-like enzyme [Haloarculaceae archaeon]|jgi:ribosomal protein S18 acetylase RimI-like enzyme
MSTPPQFDHSHRREIYEFVEQNGAVTPETARQNVLVQPDTASKPARSGSGLEPSVPMSNEEFTHHVTILERDGHLEERDGKLRVALPMEEDATTVSFDGIEATVRAAQQEDMSGVVGVIETVASGDDYVVARRLAEDISQEDVLVRYNRSEDRVFFVATVDSDVVGWLHVGGTNAPNMGHTATLTVGVLDQYRGHGLGSTLVESGLEWADTQDYRKIYQALPATNERAISFLEAQGWTVESTRTGHYRIDDELIDEVQLAIWLDE